MTEIAIGRVIGTLISIASFGIAIWFADQAVVLNRHVQLGLYSRPMEATLDLSRPGRATAPFHHACDLSSILLFYVELNTDDVKGNSAQELFRGMSGRIVIKDPASGTIVGKTMFDERTVEVDRSNGKLSFTHMPAFPLGDYIAKIYVDSGGTGLAGKKQKVHASYRVDGMYEGIAFLGAALAIAATVTGLVSGALVLPGIVRGGFRRAVRTAKSDGS